MRFEPDRNLDAAGIAKQAEAFISEQGTLHLKRRAIVEVLFEMDSMIELAPAGDIQTMHKVLSIIAYTVHYLASGIAGEMVLIMEERARL